MTAVEFLSELRRQNVRLWADQGKLRYQSLDGPLPPQLLEQIVEHKAELLDFFSQSAAAGAGLPPLTAAPRQPEMPLSFGQERLWFLDRLEPGSPAYNIYNPIRIQGPLDVAAFERSLGEIIRRHEILRTTIGSIDGRPFQRIHPPADWKIPFLDLSGLPAEEREAEAARLIDAETAGSFDLARGPLFRSSLVRLGPEEHLWLETHHHIIGDDWSMKILTQELAALYVAFKEGETPRLPELPVQYADFACWQRQWLQGETLESELGFWQRQLEGAPVLELPADFPRPASQRFRGAHHPLEFPPGLIAALIRLSSQEGVTLFMTLLAAYATLLHRYSGQQDLVIGSPTGARSQVETEGLIGYFIGVLALRVRPSGGLTFRDLLKQVRATCLKAYRHQEVPIELLIERLHIPRDLSRNPVFQTLLSMQNTPMEARAEFGGLVLSAIPADNRTAKFDLELSLWQNRSEVTGLIEYNTDLFEPARIARLATHFTTLLESAAADPDRRLPDLAFLSPCERHELLIEYNRTQWDFDRAECLHQLIEEQCTRTPDRIAVQFAHDAEGARDATLTYRELNEQANRLAHYLRSCGVGPDTAVGVSVERSPELVVSLLAILKAGGAYVPLDPEYPRERLEFMLADLGSPLVLTQAHLRDRLPAAARAVQIPFTDAPDHPAGNPDNLAGPENLAYIIYTSGSTGQPKGAMNTHRGICNRLLWMQREYGLNAGDRVLQKTPYSFDVSVWEFFWPLLAGARLVLAAPGRHRDSAYLARTVSGYGITTIHFVPSMLRVFLEQPGWERFGALKRVICSGEALPAETAERFFNRSTAELHNLYGPTEAAVDVTYWRCEPGMREPVPIGRPIANTSIYVLDPYGQPAPVGVPGELHIGGVGLARGYLGRPDLTAQRFIADPFAETEGARLYRTGDLARYRSGGVLEFLGRLDHQVKIRGFRIEPAEIEAVLKSDPGIREAVVVARRDGAGELRLVAYFCPQDGSVPTVAGLRRLLGARLPDYMIPAAFVPLPSLPLNSNGKLDRNALPEPDLSRPELDQAFAMPETPVERELLSIWSGVLRLEGIGIHDNFFELGGHSLSMIQVLSRIRDRLGTDISMRTFFQGPTIAELAARIQDESAAGTGQEELTALLEGLPEEEAMRLLAEVSEPPCACTDAYQAADLRRYPMGAGLDLVHSQESGKSILLPAEVAEALQRCRVFSPAEALPEDVAGRLADLVRGGLLVSRSRTIETLCAAAPDPEPEVPIAAIAWPTSNRSEMLASSLRSYAENRRRYGRTNAFLVADNSPLEAQRECRETLAQFARELECEIRYAGDGERRQFIEALVRTGAVEPQLLEFAIFGPAGSGLRRTGANRNALLLETVGEAFLSVDDDTACRAAEPAVLEEGIEVWSEPCPYGPFPAEVWSFPERAAAMQSVRFTDRDFVGLHSALLGRNAAGLIAAAAREGRLALDHLSARDARNPASLGRIAITLNGLVGDSGWGSPHNYLFLSPASLARLNAPGAYASACLSPEMVRAVTRTTITPRAENLMTTFIGLDNRVLLPPFLPIGRGQDMVFGVTLARCFPQAQVAHLPVALLHAPPRARTFSGDGIAASAFAIDLCGLAAACIRAVPFEGETNDPAARLLRLGANLEELGRLRLDDFLEHAGACVRSTASALLLHLEERVRNQADAPADWRSQVDRYAQGVREWAASETIAVPQELLFGPRREEAPALAQKLIADFGRLLAAWPSIIAAVQELRTSGRRFAAKCGEVR